MARRSPSLVESMKNQYFGDINDYRKYGLLRVLARGSGLSLFVGWMLTPDDGRTDGRFTDYLDNPGRWEGYDPELYTALRGWVNAGQRGVGLIERSDLLGDAGFFADLVPDSASARGRYLEELTKACAGHELVFLDPDNGLEVKSVPYGRRGSSKYTYLQELQTFFRNGHSVLVYQHFPRRKRDEFVGETAARLASELGIDRVLTFRTSGVLFLLVPRAEHDDPLGSAAREVGRVWKGQILVSELSR